jgi:hypothetical protein
MELLAEKAESNSFSKSKHDFFGSPRDLHNYLRWHRAASTVFIYLCAQGQADKAVAQAKQNRAQRRAKV